MHAEYCTSPCPELDAVGYDCDLKNGPLDPDFRFCQVGTRGQGAAPGELTLRDLTLRNACVFNGSFPDDRSSGAIAVFSSTISPNQADLGAAIEINVNINQREVRIINSLIAGGGPAARCRGSVGQLRVEGVSLADDASCPGLETVANIGLGPLADNGGSTLTHAVLPGSPALARIEDCQDFDIDRDQRGQPRPGAGSQGCDVGAYEFQVAEIFADRFEP